MNRTHGFSLIELLVGLAMLAAAMQAIVTLQVSSTALVADTSAAGMLDEKALKAVDAVAEELRWARASALLITTSNSSSRIDLQTAVSWTAGAPVWSSTITYRVVASSLDANHDGTLNEGRLVRTQDGVTRTVCEYVPSGGFTATRSGDTVHVALSLAKRDNGRSRLVQSDADTSIHLRN